MIIDAQKRPADVTFIPTHGNPEQLMNTAKAVKSEGGGFFFGNNLDVIKLSKDKTSKVDELTYDLWIGVCEESDNASAKVKYLYLTVDENFVVKDKLLEVEVEKIRQKNFRKSKQKNNNKQANTNDLSGFKQNKRLR